MEKLEALKLDKKEMDTSRAEEYLKIINNESSEWPEKGWLFLENKPNDVTKYIEVKSLMEDLLKMYSQLSNPIEIGKKLASKIEENAEMLVQLEYLARGTDPRDVRDGHVQLMSQLLKCNSALWNYFLFRYLHFNETTPLYYLATVIGSLFSELFSEKLKSITTIVVENKKMKPLCQFFVQLCRDVGLHIPIIYANPNDFKSMKAVEIHMHHENRSDSSQKTETAENIGCTGVIAERSDLDSAIDVFISSSITAPWRLKQIYVQESIFEEFKSALAAKCQLAGSNYTIGNKTFLVECLVNDQPGIPTHAYRTTKELLSFIKTPYLSVWAAETALSHEIALLSPSFTVWVNEYASFYGPPRSALSVYNLFTTMQCYVKELQEKLKPWAKLRATERLDIIVAVLKASKDPETKKFLPDLTDNFRSDELIHVTENTLCFGVQRSLGVVKINVNLVGDQEMALILKVLINGNAVLVNLSDYSFMNELTKAGVPIFLSVLPASKSLHVATASIPLVLERLKVVRTNYGTIFAN